MLRVGPEIGLAYLANIEYQLPFRPFLSSDLVVWRSVCSLQDIRLRLNILRIVMFQPRAQLRWPIFEHTHLLYFQSDDS